MMKKILYLTVVGLFLSTSLYAQSAEISSYPSSIKNVSRKVINKLKKSSMRRCTVKNFVNEDGDTDNVGFFLKNEIMDHMINIGNDIHIIDSSRKGRMGAAASNIKKDGLDINKNAKDKAAFGNRGYHPYKACFLKGRYLLVGRNLKLYIQLRSAQQNKVLMNKSFNIPIRGELAIIIDGGVDPLPPEPDPHPYPIDERYIRAIVREEIYKILGDYNHFGKEPKKTKKLKSYDYGDLSFSIKKAIKNGESIFMDVLIKNTGSRSKTYEVDDVELYYTSFFSLRLDKDLSSFDNNGFSRRMNFSLSPGEEKSALFHFDDTFDKVRNIYQLKFNISTLRSNGISKSKREISLKNVPFSNGG